ncbi:response regulator transcription factor [Collinsella sp. An2]|uniref:response regulator transcription factor n=1 Tax=Collinsella sp. An2 TaxID=1965585 RepID=UPI000B3A4D35|nr:response regulator transcription factor [Collinsella sp. An2]OUP11130.1 DNA-binding response regulator [Collinsella sp. An2]
MAMILVAEDDRNTNKLICAVMRKMGHETLSARDGREALALMDAARPDLLITDLMMPHLDGSELVRQLRDADYGLPVLMLTAKSAQADINQGFIVGADDYLTKPADLKELALRVRALLRRARVAGDDRLRAGAATLDPGALTVAGTEGKAVTLPKREFELLFKLLSNPGHTYTRMQLLDEVWGWDTESSESTVNVHVNRLRTRFADWDEFQIVTVRGVGYRGEVSDRG